MTTQSGEINQHAKNAVNIQENRSPDTPNNLDAGRDKVSAKNIPGKTGASESLSPYTNAQPPSKIVDARDSDNAVKENAMAVQLAEEKKVEEQRILLAGEIEKLKGMINNLNNIDSKNNPPSVYWNLDDPIVWKTPGVSRETLGQLELEIRTPDKQEKLIATKQKNNEGEFRYWDITSKPSSSTNKPGDVGETKWIGRLALPSSTDSGLTWTWGQSMKEGQSMKADPAGQLLMLSRLEFRLPNSVPESSNSFAADLFKPRTVVFNELLSTAGLQLAVPGIHRYAKTEKIKLDAEMPNGFELKLPPVLEYINFADRLKAIADGQTDIGNRTVSEALTDEAVSQLVSSMRSTVQAAKVTWLLTTELFETPEQTDTIKISIKLTLNVRFTFDKHSDYQNANLLSHDDSHKIDLGDEFNLRIKKEVIEKFLKPEQRFAKPKDFKDSFNAIAVLRQYDLRFTDIEKKAREKFSENMSDQIQPGLNSLKFNIILGDGDAPTILVHVN